MLSQYLSFALLIHCPKLGLKYVDLYLIHNPRLLDDVAKVWSQFEKFKDAGYAKSVVFYFLQEIPMIDQNSHRYAGASALAIFSWTS